MVIGTEWHLLAVGTCWWH